MKTLLGFCDLALIVKVTVELNRSNLWRWHDTSLGGRYLDISRTSDGLEPSLHGYNIWAWWKLLGFGDLALIFKVKAEFNRSNLSTCGGGHLFSLKTILQVVLHFQTSGIWERSGSVVECLTWDRGVVGSSHTGVTTLCPWAGTLILA